MDSLNSQIINLLSDIITNATLKEDKYKHIKWNELFRRTEEYNVLPMVYEAINNSQIINKVDRNTINEFKNKSEVIERENKKNIKKYVTILKKIKDSNIKFIITGSLITRELYSIPEIRSISNIDILISEKDLNNVDNVLQLLGYIRFIQEENKEDIIFVNKNMSVRVRCTLFNNYFISEEKMSFEDGLLKESIEVEIEKEKILGTSLEDSLISLCLDMSEQIYHNEMDLRDVIDLVLLVNKYTSILDWKSFLYKAKKCGVYRFVISIFMLENKLFNMTIPNLINNEEKLEDKYIDLLINELMIYSCKTTDNTGIASEDNTIKKTITKLKEIFKQAFSNKGNKKDNCKDELLRELGL